MQKFYQKITNLESKREIPKNSKKIEITTKIEKIEKTNIEPVKSQGLL